MTARALHLVALPEPNHTGVIHPCADLELERNLLGLLMLGHRAPDWARPEHFFPAHHQHIAKAALALHSLPLVAAELRRKGRLWTKARGLDRHSKPGMVSSVDLANMTAEAVQAMRNGWSVEWDRLRELANQRALDELMTRLCVRLRGGDVTCEGARLELREMFRGFR